MNDNFSPSRFFPLQAALFEASLALLAFILGWLLNQSLLKNLHWNFPAVRWGVVAVLPLLALLLACEHASWRPLRQVRRVLDELVAPMFSKCRWSELAAIALLAGVGEEMLFRGVLQAATANWTGDFLPHSPTAAAIGDWLAIVAVAIVFGLLHAVSAGYAVLATLMGIYLGWLFLATGNLAVPIVTHGVYDFVALVYILHRRGACVRIDVGPRIP